MFRAGYSDVGRQIFDSALSKNVGCVAIAALLAVILSHDTSDPVSLPILLGVLSLVAAGVCHHLATRSTALLDHLTASGLPPVSTDGHNAQVQSDSSSTSDFGVSDPGQKHPQLPQPALDARNSPASTANSQLQTSARARVARDKFALESQATSSEGPASETVLRLSDSSSASSAPFVFRKMSADGQDLCFNFHILRQRRCSLPASLQPDELSGGVFSLDAPVDAEESEVNNTARAFPESQAVIQRRNTALGNYGVTPRRRSEDDTGTDSSTEILYCEDDAVQRVAVRQVLKSHFKFGTTRSGEKTLEVLAQRFASGGLSALPNIVLMDQELPGLSGLETVSAIRSLYPRASMSIIMLTSTEKDEAATERKTGRLAYHRYLVKPVRRANLVDAVNCEATRLQSRANRLAKRATMA